MTQMLYISFQISLEFELNYVQFIDDSQHLQNCYFQENKKAVELKTTIEIGKLIYKLKIERKDYSSDS
jgi:hypothetical protein